MGTVALVGGSEFRPECEPMDMWLMQRTTERRPRVAILPTAAAEDNPELAAENGVRHFAALEARAYTVMILNRDDANDESLITKLYNAEMIYLTGGNPWLLFDILQGSSAFAAMSWLVRQGGVVAASSAGAMVLSDRIRHNRAIQWSHGLGLVCGVAVLPHYNRTLQANFTPLRKALDPQIAMFGIEEETACVWDDSNSWEVIGVGGVTVHLASEVRHYTAGDCFELDGA